ncbi:MAG: inositol monophosphatase, partial [Candidatus Nealsonbacteria bacterium CG15_BIG_FIL_POST_REV_8_21_14_020_37_12]
HDTIASVLIAKEAGAEATDFNGNQFTIHSENLIVARKKIHNQLLKLIKIK